MHSDGSALQRLSRDECLTLMASVPVGRIVYTRRALPAVELVNFALDHGDIETALGPDEPAPLLPGEPGRWLEKSQTWLGERARGYPSIRARKGALLRRLQSGASPGRPES